MSFQDHTNLAYSTIPSGGAPSPVASGSSLKVSSGADRDTFPTAPFMATVWPSGVTPTLSNAEIVQVNGTSGTDAFVIIRAQGGTTAKNIVAGWQIAATITDKSLGDLENAIAQKTFTTVSPSLGSDFVTDGILDNVEIQAAINAVSAAGGGTVLLRAGTYTLGAIVNLASGVNLMGEGYPTKIIQSSSYALKISGKNNIHISNIHTDADLMTAGNFYSIYMENCQNIKVTNCYIENASGFAVFAAANSTNISKYIWITDNYIHGKGTSDVVGGGPAVSTATVSDVFVQRNKIIKDFTTGGSGQGAGINFVAAKNVHFDNNIVEGDILFGTEKQPHQYSTISGNIISLPISGPVGHNRAAIGLVVSSPATAQGQAVVIANNVINSGFIDVSNSSITPVFLNVSITGNVINATNVSTALSEAGIVTNRIDGLSVNGNIVYGSTGDGIWLNNTTNSVVSGNIVRGSSGFGVRESGTSNNNQYVSNQLIANSSGSLSTLGATNLYDGSGGINSLTFTTSTSSTSTSSTSTSSTSSSISTSSTSHSTSSTSSSISTSSTSLSISTSSTSTSTTVIAYS